MRSSRGHFVKVGGLRWLCVMLPAPVPWAQRVWALPVLTALAPSERYERECGRCHKSLTERARGLLRQIVRWLHERELVLVGPRQLLGAAAAVRAGAAHDVHPAAALDARLYAAAAPMTPGQRGRAAKKRLRLAALAQVLHDPLRCWQRVLAPQWYGMTVRTVDIASGCAV
ncbi:hypothetical protein [Azohydromonas caseinilytica]|uniref:Transposase n=1 Tax=Azohydromonas caseinilytica TaxID=2728836 RepID=A0A848FDB9_9BURK|nr:hypothetical protein [Azohydromonas caseinilytica]NML17454.1 hypothetical protein [Azohydromonas caseinilytica]